MTGYLLTIVGFAVVLPLAAFGVTIVLDRDTKLRPYVQGVLTSLLIGLAMLAAFILGVLA